MGLLIEVFRNPLGDCTGGGISGTHTTLCLVNVSGPFSPTEYAPPAILESHTKGCLRIAPAYAHHDANGFVEYRTVPLWWMSGGNFGSTSDGRFGEACEKLLGHRFYGAVAIHDRTE